MITSADTLGALRRGDLAGACEIRLPGLAALPDELFGLADSLEVLDLSGGSLDALPDAFAGFAKLRVLFLSGNRFARLPPVLGACPELAQIGARGMGLREVSGEALPTRLRWLTLTDNEIARLPTALGERPALQKLLLAGNRLRTLPEGLADADGLELIRLAANDFETLPDRLTRLPSLAWLSWAGNPCERVLPAARSIPIAWGDLAIGPCLGEGASGLVHAAAWRCGDGEPRAVALKLFKGAMTSDGLPERETAACLAAGDHPHLTGGLGRLAGHPDGAQGLVMRRLPAHWRPLAGPPSLESCSRDVYEPTLALSGATALRLARGAASAVAHLHMRGLAHGDLYAHNLLWDGSDGQAVLSDFGAASTLPVGAAGLAFAQIEARAFGILLGEMRTRSEPAAEGHTVLLAAERACLQADPAARPPLAEVAALLGAPA